jgi:hypothetical protein
MSNDSRITSISRILVRGIPALLATLVYDHDATSVPFATAFKEYQAASAGNPRILLLRARSEFEAIRVAFGLALYKGFDVVGIFIFEPEKHRFEVKQSNQSAFPPFSAIEKHDVRAATPSARP